MLHIAYRVVRPIGGVGRHADYCCVTRGRREGGRGTGPWCGGEGQGKCGVWEWEGSWVGKWRRREMGEWMGKVDELVIGKMVGLVEGKVDE